MPRIIIQTNPRGGDRAEVTLSEHVLAANIDDPHYAAQLIERLAWATADAEAQESQPDHRDAIHGVHRVEQNDRRRKHPRAVHAVARTRAQTDKRRAPA